MASSLNAVLCAAGATAFWTFLGFVAARHVVPVGIAVGAAPILGWAVHSAVSLPILTLLGLTFGSVAGLALCFLVFAGVAYFASVRLSEGWSAKLPWWCLVAGAVVALAPAAAIAPKISANSVQLADPIFDHAKIAMIDAMVRLGLPPVNPFFGESGEQGRLVYYYLYYFSTAQAALAFRVSGWEAEIAMTWFAAFSSLSLTMGLAVWFGGRAGAAFWVALLTLGTALRDLLANFFGTARVDSVLATATGFAGWLFQAAWVPQHLTSASCVVLAVLLLCGYAQRQTFVRTVVLALVVVAGFECSTYVGGVTFALAALLVVPFLLLQVEPGRRVLFIIGLGVVAILVVCMTAPFVVAQVATIGQRETGAPIVIYPFEVLSEAIPRGLRRALDLPAYWLVLLPIELPAVYVAGMLSFGLLLRGGTPRLERSVAIGCTMLALVGASVSWLLVGDLGGNNDLGMRAILPSIAVLTAAAAAGVVMQPRRMTILASAIGGLLLSAPHTFDMIRYYFVGNTNAATSRIFAQTPELWAAVRRHVGPDRRVGNNPLFLKDLTPWPGNMSWALLADRNSCFAASELVLAYVPMPRERREAIYAQFIRVFDGKGIPEDVSDLANRYSCDVVVVTAQDGAWSADPFAASSFYRLVEVDETRWRIYKLKARGDGG